MMNFEFTNRALQQAHRAGALPLIGEGSFALVFEMSEQRVLKVTSDPANAALLSSQARSLKQSPAFPVVFEDRGIVGECEDCLYHAYVMERLYWPCSTRARRVIKTAAEVRQRHDVEARSTVVDAAYLRELARRPELGMHAELLALARMVEAKGWLVDGFERGNLLERADGQLCLSDPLYSLAPFKRRDEAYAMA